MRIADLEKQWHFVRTAVSKGLLQREDPMSMRIGTQQRSRWKGSGYLRLGAGGPLLAALMSPTRGSTAQGADQPSSRTAIRGEELASDADSPQPGRCLNQSTATIQSQLTTTLEEREPQAGGTGVENQDEISALFCRCWCSVSYGWDKDRNSAT